MDRGESRALNSQRERRPLGRRAAFWVLYCPAGRLGGPVFPRSDRPHVRAQLPRGHAGRAAEPLAAEYSLSTRRIFRGRQLLAAARDLDWHGVLRGARSRSPWPIRSPIFWSFAPGAPRACASILLLIPFWTSFLLRVMSWKFLLGSEGVINSLLAYVEAIAEPLERHALQPQRGHHHADLRLDSFRGAADRGGPAAHRARAARVGGRPRRAAMA